MTRKTFTIILLGSFLFFFCAEPAVKAEDIMLDEIVIKGKKEQLNQESLTVKEVRESPARDIGEALQQVGGINIVRKGAIANDVVLRGQQKDNINVFIDGARIHGACPSRMDSPLFHCDFEEVEEISIIKGPYDLTNPGGIGGVINIIPVRPGKGFAADAGMTFGSFEMVNASAKASYGADCYDGLLGYAYKYSLPPRSGNGKRITDIYPDTSANRYKESTMDSRAYEINTGWGRVGVKPTQSSQMDFAYSYQDAEHVYYPYLSMDAAYDRTHQFNWNYRIENISNCVREIKLQAYWDKVEHLMNDKERVSSDARPFDYSMQTYATTRLYGTKLNGTFSAGPGTLVAGLDYYNRNWDATNKMAMTDYMQTNMIPDVLINNVGGFAGYEMPIVHNLTLKGGLRGDLTWAGAHKKTNKASDSSDFSTMGGNIQLIWEAAKHLEATLGFGSGVRTPDPQELYINSAKQQGNPFLDPTRNNEFDLGVKYATDKFYIKGAIFGSKLKNFIYLYQLGTIRSFRNISATIWGGEISSQAALPCNLFFKWSCSYTHGENESDSRPLSEIPPFKGMASLRYDVNDWFVELAENFEARQNRVDKSLSELPTAGWATTDVRAGYNFQKLSVYGGVTNLWDKQYYSYLSYLRDPFATGVKVPENGRTLYMTVTYKF